MRSLLFITLLALSNVSGHINEIVPYFSRDTFIETSDNIGLWYTEKLENQYHNFSIFLGTIDLKKDMQLIGISPLNDLFDWDDSNFFSVSFKYGSFVTTYTDYNVEWMGNDTQKIDFSDIAQSTYNSGVTEIELYYNIDNVYSGVIGSSYFFYFGLMIAYPGELESVYNNGYETGYETGYTNGYKSGTEGATGIWEIFNASINSLNNILSVEILPGWRLWYFIAFPLLLGVVSFVIGFFR